MMAIEYRDGTFGPTMPLKEAIEKFVSQAETGLVKALHIGSPAEIEQRKMELDISARIKQIEDEMTTLRVKKSGLIHIPTEDELKPFIS